MDFGTYIICGIISVTLALVLKMLFNNTGVSNISSCESRPKAPRLGQPKNIFVDMDGVLADFNLGVYEALVTKGYKGNYENFLHKLAAGDKKTVAELSDVYKKTPGFFLSLKPLSGAIFAEPIHGAKNVLEYLRMLDYEVYICTAPSFNNPDCMTDKVAWIKKHFMNPNGKGFDWRRRIVFTKDKTILRADSVLIDDKFEIKGANPLIATHIHFNAPFATIDVKKQKTTGVISVNSWHELLFVQKIL
jgi:5'(3')-deoxyribonucleotidase